MECKYPSDVTVDNVQVMDVLETTSDVHQLMPRWERYDEHGHSTIKRKIASHQLQPGGTGPTREIFHDVFLANRFENAGVGELATREDAKEWYDVRMGQITTNEGMAVESLYPSSQ